MLNTEHRDIDSQAGFALPLALGISMLVTVIILSISDSVSHRIGLATNLDNHVRAELKTYSAYNKVLYNLLTSTHTPTGLNTSPSEPDVNRSFGPQENNPENHFWNLYNKEINLEPDVTVKLQDMAGMISPLFSTKILRNYFSYVLNDPDQANRIVDTLSDWQDKDDFKRLQGAESWDYKAKGIDYVPRNFHIQSLEELMLLKDFDHRVMEKIISVMTYWPSGYINYLTMEENLLRALILDDNQVEQIIGLRMEKSLTPQSFTAITGIPETEDSIFHTSSRIRLEIISAHETARDRLIAFIDKRPDNEKPFAVLEWKR